MKQPIDATRYELFMKEIAEFLQLSTSRLNIQANMANRTGYFFIVNQATGLVLQAVDFATDASLAEQIEKKRQQQSFKGQPATKPPAGSTVSKGPRFYLMNKINPSKCGSFFEILFVVSFFLVFSFYNRLFKIEYSLTSLIRTCVYPETCYSDKIFRLPNFL